MNLDDLRGWMTGTDCVVVGCGPSADGYWEGDPRYKFPIPDGDEWEKFKERSSRSMSYADHWTIGCNRATAYCSPDFAVCVEPRREKTCWDTVTASAPLIIFSHLDSPHPRSVRIGTKDVRQWVDPVLELLDDVTLLPLPPPKGGYPNPLRLSQSPFIAVACAILLGFETIGLIGVDLTADRFGDAAVAHSNSCYRRLADIAKAQGSRVINLSPESRLTSLEAGTWDQIRTK